MSIDLPDSYISDFEKLASNLKGAELTLGMALSAYQCGQRHIAERILSNKLERKALQVVAYTVRLLEKSPVEFEEALSQKTDSGTRNTVLDLARRYSSLAPLFGRSMADLQGSANPITGMEAWPSARLVNEGAIPEATVRFESYDEVLFETRDDIRSFIQLTSGFLNIVKELLSAFEDSGLKMPNDLVDLCSEQIGAIRTQVEEVSTRLARHNGSSPDQPNELSRDSGQ